MILRSRVLQILSCIFLAGFAVLHPNPISAQTCNLTVTIASLENNLGVVYVSLYNMEDGYPTDATKAFLKSPISIYNKQAVLTFKNIPPGLYAAACYHDEDGNGKLNTNFLGIPTEGTGASNDAKGFLGPPKFEDAKFAVRGDTSITIHIRY